MAEKNILIIVDMQNDFIDGALGTKEAQAITPRVIERILACKADGYTLIATMDTHGENYLDTPEGKKLPVPHCIRGTEGWQIREDIRSAMGDCIKVEKPGFASLDLPGVVKAEAGDCESVVIELLGVCTDICVVSNALMLKAYLPEAKIAVHAACCAGVTPEKHEAALETMRSCQIDVI